MRSILRFPRRWPHQGDQLLFNGDAGHACAGRSIGAGIPTSLRPAPDDATDPRRIPAHARPGLQHGEAVPVRAVAERYFEIADEEGMFLWLELPLWLPHVTSPAASRRATNTPTSWPPSITIPRSSSTASAASWARTCDAALLDALNAIGARPTCGVLVCDNSGSGEAYDGWPSIYADFNDYHFYADLHVLRAAGRPVPARLAPAAPADLRRILRRGRLPRPGRARRGKAGSAPGGYLEQNPIHPLGKPTIEQEERMAAQRAVDERRQLPRCRAGSRSSCARRLWRECARGRAWAAT